MQICTWPEKPTKGSDSRIQSNTEIANFAEYFIRNDTVLRYIASTLFDCYNCSPLYGYTDFERDKRTILARFHHEGLSFATQTLPSFFDSLVNYLETGVSDYPGFKKKPGASYPAFLQQLVAPIYDDPYSADTALSMKLLYQLCVSFKKLRGPYREGVLRKQLSEFVETDIELGYLEFDSEPNRCILRHAKRTIGRVLRGLDPFDPTQAQMFLPKPGPGATNTPTKNHMRFQPHVMYTRLSEVFDYETWFYPPSYPPRGRRPWDLRVGRTVRKTLKEEYEPTSRFKFVPKTYAKARGICIEQLETQYLQQGIKNALYERIESHPETKGKVNFASQDVNGELAVTGSATGELATIDMSSASDRISRRLVAYLFGENAAMLNALLTLSTNTIELPDTINFIVDFPSAKFAPMGSALCFPIMALVHYALIKAIIVFSNAPHDKTSLVYVYGDDIIIHRECVQAVYDWLPRFGMKLNKEKSFYRSRFRESCGVHAYNGIIITPSRFKSVIDNSSPYSELISALKLEADLYNKGFFETAKTIRTAILKVKRYRASHFPIVSPKSAILGWIREFADAPFINDFDRMKRRWNVEHQCFEFRVQCLVPVNEILPPLEDEKGYLRKLVTRTKLDAKKVNGSCEDIRIRHRWLPESAFCPLSTAFSKKLEKCFS